MKDDSQIYTVGGQGGEDYPPLLDAARKAVEHGYRVFILPNPKGFRTADFIFERKGVYKMFDLKTIIGKNSVGNRLKESVGQTYSVLLNLKCSYGIRNITDEIRRHFESSPDAVEVLIRKQQNRTPRMRFVFKLGSDVYGLPSQETYLDSHF